MKKLLAVLIACSAVCFAVTGCGDKEKSESESVSESSEAESSEVSSADEESSGEDEADEESSGEDESSGSESSFVSTAPAVVEAGQIDDALVGTWYNEESVGTIYFSDAGRVAMGIDYTSIMHFDADKNFVIPDSTGEDSSVPAEYDGTNLRVVLSSELMGIEEDSEAEPEKIEFLTLKRTDESNADSLDGEYEMVGGQIFEEFTEMFLSDIDNAGLYITVSGENLTLKIEFCNYAADGSQVEMYGSGAALFGIESQEDALMTYTISGDVLSMTDSYGETMDFTKQ